MNTVDWSSTWINVISKSGTTTEPGLAFRILYDRLEKEVGQKEANRRVIATTDKSRGALRRLATKNGFQTFLIPDDVGGRFSVFTAVGLLPIAAAGINPDVLLAGAGEMRKITRQAHLDKNPALLYAALRNILYRKGKSIEILANFEPALHYVSEWWKQLFGESEGKAGKGIFPVAVDLSTDLHSLGQMIQDGPRQILETFLILEKEPTALIIPHGEEDYDGFNYLAGKKLDFVNQKAFEGTAQAHKQGGCPNMTIFIPELSEFYLGQLFYFFEYAVAISGYILGVNPFDQPGVEAYKSNMFRLLGKAGF
jgi:glucose-6-phosphate isomerase